MSMQINTNANYTAVTRPPVIDVMEKRRLEAQNTNPPTTNTTDGPAAVYESSGLLGKDAERLSESNLKFGSDARPLGLLADRLSATNTNVKTFAEAFTSFPVANTNAKPVEEPVSFSDAFTIPDNIKQSITNFRDMQNNKMALMTETAQSRLTEVLSTNNVWNQPTDDLTRLPSGIFVSNQLTELVSKTMQDVSTEVEKFWNEKFPDINSHSPQMPLDDIRKEFADWKALQ